MTRQKDRKEALKSTLFNSFGLVIYCGFEMKIPKNHPFHKDFVYSNVHVIYLKSIKHKKKIFL